MKDKINIFEFSPNKINIKFPMKKNDNEWNFEKIKEEISGQASDGWCEGFEQREIKCNGKEIYVSFWQSKNWSLQTAEELGISESKQELTMGGM